MSRRFGCPDCGKEFCSQFSLNRHSQSIHYSNAKLFPCDFPGCSYSSPQEPNVRAHYNSLHLKKGQLCTLCSKKYCDMSSLIKHEKRIHDFYRKKQKAHANLKPPVDEVDVNGVFIKDKQEMFASMQPMWSSSAVFTPSSIFFPTAPAATSSSNPMSIASLLNNEPSYERELRRDDS